MLGRLEVKGEEERVESREGRGGRTGQPILINIGVAVACSFAGFLLSQIGNRIRPNSTLPSSAVIEEEEEEEGASSCNLTQEKSTVVNEINNAKTEIGSIATLTAVSTLSSPSLTRSSSGDEVGFLLPEFNDLVLEELGSSMPDLDPDPNRNLTQIQSSVELENEISFLRNMVSSLQEREKSLELQMQESYNLKEQANSICQLENQLKVKNVETKLYTIKMESLLSENHNLRAQLSRNSTISARSEEARKQIKILTDRVQILREETDQMRKEEEAKSKRFKELEEELKDLRLVNACLEKEKSELKRQLQMQTESQLDPTCHTSTETETIEEAQKLRQEVEKLTKEIEQLKISRCADLEELVYLKWINACLRYELRDHQPIDGKTLARDLSITLSPSSKQKAKELIQDYAYDSVPTFFDDPNWEYSSESSGDSSKISNSGRTKLFGKLKDLLLGKDEKMIERGEDTPSFSSWGSTASSSMIEESALPVQFQKPFEQQDKLARSRSDCLSYRRNGIVPIEEGFAGNSYDETEVPEKMRLRKLAAALGDSIGNINRRTVSFSCTTSNSFAVEYK